MSTNEIVTTIPVLSSGGLGSGFVIQSLIDSFEFSGGWPGTIANPYPTPSFAVSSATDSFEFAELWPQTIADPNPTPTFATATLSDSFDTVGSWPGVV